MNFFVDKIINLRKNKYTEMENLQWLDRILTNYKNIIKNLKFIVKCDIIILVNL